VSQLTLGVLCTLHSMRSRVYETVRRPSVTLSHSPAAAACSGFAAVGSAGIGNIDGLLHGERRSSSTRPQHGAQQLMRAVPRFQRTCRVAEHADLFHGASLRGAAVCDGGGVAGLHVRDLGDFVP